MMPEALLRSIIKDAEDYICKNTALGVFFHAHMAIFLIF